jgi:glutamate---cysteine ligase / carboxylate-amine ligase
VEHAFGRSAPFSLGIEEEFQLVSPESFELVPRFDEIAEAAGDERIRQELMTSVLEAATGVHEHVGAAMQEVREIRALLRDATAERSVLIASAGTHPFSRWEHQEITDSPRYQKVAEGLRWVVKRVAIFGLHVHVGIDDADTAVRVATQLRSWVPELLALSSNSPYWQGRDTGLASTRSQVFDTMPRSGLPPRFESFADFVELVRRGVAAEFFPEYTYIWWDVRPHPKLGTVELRACDAQTRVDSVAAIAALTQCLVATLVDEPVPIEPLTLIAENKWRAVRHGLHAQLVDLAHDRARSAPEAIRELVERAAPAADRLGCEPELAEVERLLERGSGADEQRRINDEEGGPVAVARHLAEETVRGLG